MFRDLVTLLINRLLVVLQAIGVFVQCRKPASIQPPAQLFMPEIRLLGISEQITGYMEIGRKNRERAEFFNSNEGLGNTMKVQVQPVDVREQQQSSFRIADIPTGTGTNGLDERIGLKSSKEREATLIPVDDHALLIPATTGSERAMVTFSEGPIRLRSARLARNSANIQHAPIAARL